MDYIQWLLEEDEDARTEEAAPEEIRLPRQKRRLFGRLGIDAQETKAAVRDGSPPEGIRRQSDWETDGSLPGEKPGGGEAELARRLGRGKPSTKRLAAAAGIAGGEAELIQGDRALGLYNALRKAGRAERRAAGTAAPAVTIREVPARDAEALGPLELDRCFEREARRYDNGFSLL